MTPNHHLHGNFAPCPACALRQEMQDRHAILRERIVCQVCDGSGHLPLSVAEIVRRTVDEARRIYWPEFERVKA